MPLPVRPGERLHFGNPPIVEAAIGISVSRLPETFFKPLKDLALSAESVYASPTPLHQNRFQMTIQEGQSTASTLDEPLGWRWESTDRLHVVQCKLDGFSFSRMGHYETWETFTAEANRVWSIYLAAVGAVSFQRFGVRYINKVYIPEGHELSDFLNVYPKTPPGLLWGVNNSFMRLGMEIDVPLRGSFVHQHVLIPSDRKGFAAVILDNDFQYSVDGPTNEDLWRNINSVRDVKDQYFLQLVTERLAEGFDV